MRLRAGLLALLLVLGSVAAVYAATLTLFTAAYSGAVVKVEWEVSNEVDVTGFELARKSATDASYSMVSTTAATGQRRYLYLDANVYRGTATTTTLGGPYTYRLTVRSPAGDQSYLTVLAGTPSAVQRSWGTIKSMFR
ncbi:hypothetical protein MON38_21120 [Hymenobacter sp. DH14]|uniref:Fibronectin type-III domain-containing protein n=1 Tax=Hymenobacter cyanobacteriorum TaxID=2926463 RepID=A0A9X1VKK8_9BACT|nr:hypothetical protein [Hymenobacter cyanobacteriorum]MCI1189933.1 hypothetical protein [Hymenobacter cyanobacteriorum]